MLGSISAIHLAVLIPIIFVCGAIVVAVVAVIIHGRNKDLAHRERLVAMEKGIPLPEPTINRKKPVHSARRAWALIFIGVGLALVIALWAVEGVKGGVWGFLPLFIGIGLLTAAILDKKEYEEDKRSGQ
ncbi:MAG: DUF6249 domain-containing protein [Candidatus Latescibacterota bacterium]